MTSAQLVYTGIAGVMYHTRGGGVGPSCLPLDPNFLAPLSGSQSRTIIYGAEY